MSKYHLFEKFGIELEYMVVKNKELSVFPIVDKLLKAKAGFLTSTVENGAIAWSNELVAHVVELKTNYPADSLKDLGELFHQNILEINLLLKPFDAQLLATAAHPLMDPKSEMQLWQHSYNEVYALYHRIFNCRGHGWANVQSMHINLPFYNDTEFERLHAAIRILLPIIPGLSASSPLFDGQWNGIKDRRLEVYKTNQKEIPVLTGKVIPERVYSQNAYHETIFNPIIKAIKPYDVNEILEHHFLNSRGAIARFDRHAIEIRVVDIQECPKADLAIAAFLIAVLQFLICQNEKALEKQKSWHEDELLVLFDEVIKKGEDAVIENKAYLKLFGLQVEETTLTNLWQYLFRQVQEYLPEYYHDTLKVILEYGTLSSRIMKSIGKDITPEEILKTYRKLGECLRDNNLFIP